MNKVKKPVMQFFVQRQNQLLICKLLPEHRWFWSACYDIGRKLIGMELQDDECVRVKFNELEVERMGFKYFEKTRSEMLEKRREEKKQHKLLERKRGFKKIMGYLFESKKSTSMGLPLAVWSALGGIIVVKYLAIPAIAVAGYFVMMGLVVGGHMVAYGMADAASTKPVS